MSDRDEEILQVGIAGLGSMGGNHLRNLRSRDDVRVVAIADPEPNRRAHATEVAGPELVAFETPSEMLANADLDAVVVAVPTTYHFSVTMEAISRNIAVLVEKPIASRLVDAQQMVQAAEANEVVLQVGHIERFNPVVIALREQLRAGRIGRIHSVKTVRGGPLPERIRDVGVAIDLATHDIDIMINLVGERPVRVSAEASRMVHTSHEDLLYGLLHFPSGSLGLLDVNWLTPEKQRNVVILGTEGMLKADYLTQSLTFTVGRSELSAEYHRGFAPMFSGDSMEVPVAPAEPLQRELDSFLSAVRAGGPAPVSGSDGVAALEIAKLLLASADSGRSVPVPSAVGA